MFYQYQLNLMNKDLQQQIKSLEKEILKEELKISNAEKKDAKFVRKSLSVIESNLKYLSIVANGVPLDKKENMKIMEFLRIHHENMWNLSLPA